MTFGGSIFSLLSIVFDRILSLSLVGSYIILFVLVVRLLMKKSPGWCSYMLWAVVFLRLIIPVFPESGFSLIPPGLQMHSYIRTEYTADMLSDTPQEGMPDEIQGGGNADEIDDGGFHMSGGENVDINIDGTDIAGVNEGGLHGNSFDTFLTDPERESLSVEDSSFTEGNGGRNSWLRILAVAWAAGVIGFGAYHIHSYMFLKKQVRNAIPVQEGVCEIQGGHLSFVLGIFRPVIYLSGELDEDSREVVLCHEQVHLKRKDYLIKPAALFITCIHWFNPLVWLAFYLMSRDCETSCDEKVITLLGEKCKKIYSYALLDEAVEGQRQQYKRRNTCAVLSFGEDDIKNRIKHVLNFKKAPMWLLIITIVGMAVLIWGFCSDLRQEKSKKDNIITASESGETDEKTGTAEVNGTVESTEAGEMTGTIESAEAAEMTETVKDVYSITRFQDTPENTLERWASAFTEREGNTLYLLSHDREEFTEWSMIETDENGDYKIKLTASRPVQAAYEIQYEPGDEEARIRYWMVNDVPEIYPAYETVKLVQDADLFYVDHQSFTEYSVIESLEEFQAAYGRDYREAYAVSLPYELASYEKSGYTKAFLRTIMQHVFYETDPDYYNGYKDPVSAAKLFLHLGEGSGEVTEYLHAVQPARLWSSGIGEGSIVLVTYTFAADHSKVELPMVLVDESLGIWGLSTGDLTGMENAESALPNDTYMTRTYKESVGDNGGNQYEFSELGICALNIYGEEIGDRRLIYPKFVPEAAAVWLWEDKLYFPTSARYSDAVNSFTGSLDWAYDSVCEIHMQTGEYRYIPLPEELMKDSNWSQINVHSGFLFKNGGKGAALADAKQVWEGRTVFELTEEQKDAYGVHMREYILQHPGEIIRAGNRSHEQTMAVVDMDGDGSAEEISIVPDTEERGHRYYPYDIYELHTGENAEERFANRLNNEIWLFSPDGEVIYAALYEDGPSDDPKTSIFGYVDGKLKEIGTIGYEIENFQFRDGVIQAVERKEIIQTDYLEMSYVFVDGKLEQVKQDTYDFIVLNEITLLQELTLHTLPDGSETFLLQPQSVRFSKTDESMSWVFLEAENGQSGWFQMTDIRTVYGTTSTSDLFYGLILAD